jgi:hypothetical protein
MDRSASRCPRWPALIVRFCAGIDGVDVNTRRKDGDIALIVGARVGSSDACKRCWTARRLVIGQEGSSALHMALSLKSSDSLHVIFRTERVDVNQMDGSAMTPKLIERQVGLMDIEARFP